MGARWIMTSPARSETAMKVAAPPGRPVIAAASEREKARLAKDLASLCGAGSSLR
jgi:hypothetical protein